MYYFVLEVQLGSAWLCMVENSMAFSCHLIIYFDNDDSVC